MNHRSYLKDLNKAYRSVITPLSPKQLEYKEDNEAWSIAEVLWHLVAINESYFPVFKALKADNYQVHWLAKLGIVPRSLGRLILNSVEPSRTKKIKTFAIWEPKTKESTPVVLAFWQQQEQLEKWIDNLEDEMARGTIIASPANPKIVYSLKDAMSIILTHEERHLNQIREKLI